MRDLLPANQAALVGRVVMPREFLQIEVRDRETGAAVYERMWSDRGPISAQVRNIDTGGTDTWAFAGAAGLVQIGDIPMVANLEVQEIEITMAAYGVDVDRLLRTYDPNHAPVTIWRGYLNVESRLMVAPAEPIFFGFIDGIDLPTGAEGSEAFAKLTCVSHTQELTRSNPETRSDASQRRRHPDDAFFEGVNALKDRTFFWGQKKETVQSDTRGIPDFFLYPGKRR